MVRSTDRQTLISQLFDKWDRNCSGFLEVDELQMVLRKWKALDSRGAKEHGKPSSCKRLLFVGDVVFL